MSITIRDFCPINRWKVDREGEKRHCCREHEGEPEFIIDGSTGRRYWNEDRSIVRIKSFGLTLGTPVIHSVAIISNMAYRVLKTATLSHFWMEEEGETT